MILLYNAKIYTQDPLIPFATALVIRHGIITAIGTDQDILSEFSHIKNKIDFRGKAVLPGFTDSHIHLGLYAQQLSKVDCETKTKEICLARVAEKAKNTPAGEWILGHGWNQNVWESGYGTIDDLDRVAPNHPVYLTSKSIHAAWVNRQAFSKAGITEQTPDPEGGTFLKTSEGKLSGIILEKAVLEIERVIPKPTPKMLADLINNAQANLWKFGITGVHDFDDNNTFNALQILEINDQLKLRVIKSIPFEYINERNRYNLRSGFGSSYMRIGSVKLFADGALGPQTAAMMQPYSNDPSNVGMLLLDSKQIEEAGITAINSGLSLAIHAIGDRANHEALNAFDHIRKYELEHGDVPLNHRIEHAQILLDKDIKRFHELNIVASVQPIHATSDMDMVDRYWGKERSPYAYPFQSLLNHKTTLTFGSDAPVESPNPFLGIHAAVTRQRTSSDIDNRTGWNPQECISVHNAIAAYTRNPAIVANLDSHLGKLLPGYDADLIACAQNPYQIDPSELHHIYIHATMVGGQWVWDDGFLTK